MKMRSMAVAFGLLLGSFAVAYATSETVATWFGQSNTNPVLSLQQEGSTAEAAFSCNLQATVNVANTTTELVALSAGKTIRVCGFLLENATAGTFKFIDGTGTACATSASDLMTALPVVDKAVIAMPAGFGSLVRTRVGRALCLTAGTGTVVGVVSYAQY